MLVYQRVVMEWILCMGEWWNMCGKLYIDDEQFRARIFDKLGDGLWMFDLWIIRACTLWDDDRN